MEISWGHDGGQGFGVAAWSWEGIPNFSSGHGGLSLVRHFLSRDKMAWHADMFPDLEHSGEELCLLPYNNRSH